MPHQRLQLPLPFQHQPRFDAGDFIPATSNQPALAWLNAAWPDQRLALFGPAGCGKSHLLHIWAQRTGAPVLSGPVLTDLESIPPHGGLALDDADIVRDETLLLHLLNTARDRSLHLLLSGRTAPARWPARLPDLSSRLRAITAVEIAPPDDELLSALLKRLVADRQLVMSQAAQDFLLVRLPRSPAALREAVTRLDRESLIHGAPITRSLAQKLLKDGDFDVVNADEGSVSAEGPSSRGDVFL
jgi:chromosomal replication initiation ATPase DnaA